MSIHSILARRGARYGNFTDQAEHCLIIKGTIFGLMGIEKVQTLKSDQIEAISNIANKLARITNGDPHYHDSWQDIAGYAQLVADRLIADEKAQVKAEAEAPAEQAKDDAPCDCPACQLRTVLGAQHVVLVVETDDEDSEDDEQELTAACKKASDALHKLVDSILASRFTAN
jgi:hypothetical protein